MSSESEFSILERAIGAVVGGVLYREFRPIVRRAEVRVHIKRHVEMAEEVKDRVDEVQEA